MQASQPTGGRRRPPNIGTIITLSLYHESCLLASILRDAGKERAYYFPLTILTKGEHPQ